MQNSVYVFECGCQYERDRLQYSNKKPTCRMHKRPIAHIIVTCEHCGTLHQVGKSAGHTKLCPDCKQLDKNNRNSWSTRTRHFACGCAHNASVFRATKNGIKSYRCPTHGAALTHNSIRCKSCHKIYILPKSQQGSVEYCPACVPQKNAIKIQRETRNHARTKRQILERHMVQSASTRSDCQFRDDCLTRHQYDARMLCLPCLGCNRYTPPPGGMIQYGDIYAYKHGFEISDLATTEGI